MITPIKNYRDSLDAIELDLVLGEALRPHIFTEEVLQHPRHLKDLTGVVQTLSDTTLAVLNGEGRAMMVAETRFTAIVTILDLGEGQDFPNLQTVAASSQDSKLNLALESPPIGRCSDRQMIEA